MEEQAPMDEAPKAAAVAANDDELTGDIVVGMQYASLAITDDQPDTLKNVGKMNPWHIEALKMITGSEEEAHAPLSTILAKHMNLECDAIIDKQGTTPGGHFLDTQGYIAHNDEVIVLAFRCTTSFYDWLTNFDTTSSEWEIAEDVAQGYSGYCSALEGLTCCGTSEHKPRVHTGFYNNFLSIVPELKQHVEPLLAPDQPPRKLFVVGHSLGAGIANMAACYFLLQFDWNVLPHRLVSVTAGSPRSCQGSMRNLVQEELERYGSHKTAFCRIRRNQDVVTTVPPKILGFKHIGRLVYITDDNRIELQVQDSDDHDVDEEKVEDVEFKGIPSTEEEDDDDDDDAENPHKPTKYEKTVSKIPTPFRDHMPDFYLKPMRIARHELFPVELLVG